ncbi:kinase-like domain-containing protein [Lophiotrema nucula]|uniref:Kinase-like domain-containing protein n=1 Tax=Lophiotrema nucula TaxID=690887 RepID=A0A6A5ZIN2_9PLEO|nr:kinase-like domain-containing protein [Lophiotrema nucula]
MAENPWIWDTARAKYYRFDHANQLYIFEDGDVLPLSTPSPTLTREEPPAPVVSAFAPLAAAAAYPTPSDSGSSTQTYFTHSTGASIAVGPCPQPTDDLANGRYKVLRTLERGGQTREKGVQQAQDSHDGNIYALKTYVCHNVYQYNDRAANFDREVSIMSRLSQSPHVVKMIRSHKSPETLEYAFVMQPVANQGSLLYYLRSQFRSPQMVLFSDSFTHMALLNLAKGLHDIHRHSVRHKDIKPGNILLHDDDILYTDFGLSLDFNGYSTDETDGPDPEHDCTRAYAAAETFAHKPRNRRSDIFCLGCIFLEIVSARCVAITGETEWEDDTIFGDDFVRYHEMVANGRIHRKLESMLNDDRLHSIHRYLPLISKMMRADRDKRPDAIQLLNDIVHNNPYVS